MLYFILILSKNFIIIIFITIIITILNFNRRKTVGTYR